MTGGWDPRSNPLIADKSSFQTMTNIRQSPTKRGQLEQTPRFGLIETYNRGTYNLTGGANATEPSTSAVRYYDQSLVVTEFSVMNLMGLQMKCFRQITVPTTTGVTGGCLLTIVDPAAVTVNLGARYDVQIDGAATFQWRVNAGAWTTLVPIDAVNGNLIDGGAVRLYWLASTGFTLNDLWQWRRTDFSDGYLAHKMLHVGSSYYYVGSYDNRVNVIEYYPSSALFCMRTVGYRPVYATTLNVYENHLFCLGLQEDLTTLGGSWMTCSDLNNLDNFIPTDTNEADSFNLVLIERAQDLNNLYILDSAVLQSRFFVLTSAGMYYSDYAGLPTPFSFKFLLSLPATQSTVSLGTMLETPYGIMLATGHGIYAFNGAGLEELMQFAAYGILVVYKILYNASTQEVVFAGTSSALVYQPVYKTFYLRTLSFDNTNNPLAIFAATGAYYVGISSRRALREDTNYTSSSGSLVNDATSGAAMQTPTLMTQALGGEYMSVVKENQPLYLVPDVSTSASNGTAFSKSTNIQITAKLVAYDSGVAGTETTIGTWTSAKVDGLVQVARTSFRAAALKLEFSGLDSGKPPGKFTLSKVETSVYTIETKTPGR